MRRLVLTYNQSCNLSCDFCYVNFHHNKIQDKTYEIVQKAISYNFDIITFGGGDSFSKKSFRDACILAKMNNLFTHVDTNGISINSNDFDFIEKYVDLIGISIDGVGEDHDRLRKSKQLFNKINSVLEKLGAADTRIKINTILTNQNKSSINDVFTYLKSFRNIELWSIYQFFPLSAANKNKEVFEISEQDYDTTLAFLENENASFKIEKFKFKDRVNGYIFCDEEGNIYTNSIEGDYINLFSIFDNDAEAQISKLEEFINPKTRDRYIKI